MDWWHILFLLVGALVGLLGPLSVMLIGWLKAQPWVKKLHLEDFFAAVIPQIVEWIEYWAAQLPEKPAGEEKMAEAIKVFREEHPTVKVSDDMIKRRIEVHLRKSD